MTEVASTKYDRHRDGSLCGDLSVPWIERIIGRRISSPVGQSHRRVEKHRARKYFVGWNTLALLAVVC